VPATVTCLPIAKPWSQASGRPSTNGSAVPPVNGAATHTPDSSPVVSRCQTIHSPSGVISPAMSPTGSLVIWRRSPVARSQAWSW
jgi:hypothetical protein